MATKTELAQSVNQACDADRCAECGHMRKKHLRAGCLTCLARNEYTANDSYKHKFVEPEEDKRGE